LDRFAACWDELDDPRTGNAGLRDFHELLFIALCSELCGGQGALEECYSPDSSTLHHAGMVDHLNREAEAAAGIGERLHAI